MHTALTPILIAVVAIVLIVLLFNFLCLVVKLFLPAAAIALAVFFFLKIVARAKERFN